MWFQQSTKGHLHVFELGGWGLSFPDQVLGHHHTSADMPRRGPLAASKCGDGRSSMALVS